MSEPTSDPSELKTGESLPQENGSAPAEDRPATVAELAKELRHLQDRLITAHYLIRSSRFDADNKFGVNRDAYRSGKRIWMQEIGAPLRIWVAMRREARDRAAAEEAALKRYEKEQKRDR